MTKRNVMIDILTSRTEMNLSLFAEEPESEEIEEGTPSLEEILKNVTGEMPEPTEMLMEGRLLTSTHRVELVYAESELTGMQGSMTAIGFDRDQPGMISMIRSGNVSTALIFEEGERHYSVFDTPLSTFQLCTYTELVENRLLTDGTIRIEYIIEIRGAQAECCHMDISVCDDISPFKIIQ